MCPGLSDDLQQIHDARKTAIIDRELSKLKVNIAALQETRLPASGSLKEKDYTFFWQGLEPEERRLYGVGFAVRNTLLSSMEPPSQGTARILSLSASRPHLDQQTSSASTPPHSALQPRLRMHSTRSLKPRSERSHRKKTCSYLETSTPG